MSWCNKCFNFHKKVSCEFISTNKIFFRCPYCIYKNPNKSELEKHVLEIHNKKIKYI